MMRARLLILFLPYLLIGCVSQPTIATDVTYCCRAGTDGIHTFRVEFEDTPEFLKPMLRDEAAIGNPSRAEHGRGQARATTLRVRFMVIGSSSL